MNGAQEGENGLIHLVAGGIGGTTGSVLTCPLEVVKVRLQSSEFAGRSPAKSAQSGLLPTTSSQVPSSASQRHFLRSQLRWPSASSSLYSTATATTAAPGIVSILRKIVAEEGVRALWKGAVPNVLGVAPSKAIYFYAYSSGKRFLAGETGQSLLHVGPAGIHMLSAATAGFITASVINPVWVVKTRLQLSHSANTVAGLCRSILTTEGPRGFYRGVTASYVGIGETVVQFVIYEALREAYLEWAERGRASSGKLGGSDFAGLMCCAGVAKLCATVSMYPHEVCRTRMREAGGSYGSFASTFSRVKREEGWRALYRGLGVHLLRTLPNAAIVMGTYEGVVYLLRKLNLHNAP